MHTSLPTPYTTGVYLSHSLLVINISHCCVVHTHATFQSQNSSAPLEQTPHLLLYSMYLSTTVAPLELHLIFCCSTASLLATTVLLEFLTYALYSAVCFSGQPQLPWSKTHLLFYSMCTSACAPQHPQLLQSFTHLLLYSIHHSTATTRLPWSYTHIS